MDPNPPASVGDDAMDMEPSVPSTSDFVSPLPTSTPSITSLVNPPIRGRPRSTSISNGSPGPAPGATFPLPSLFPETNPPASSPWGFRGPGLGATAGNGAGGSGWGHRPSLSVPGIVSPLPVAPGGVARGGRHRRTQSVSPPGFPILSEGEVSGFAAGVSQAGPAPIPLPSKVGASSSERVGRKESPSRVAGKIDDHLRLHGVPIHPSKISIPRAESPKRGASSSPRNHSHFSPSTSPTSTSGLHSHSHHGLHGHYHPTSHAALLSGIRSHALPHSPTLTATSFDEASNSGVLPDAIPPRRNVSRSPTLTSSPHSPPFGPTSPNSHHPSPLALELHRRSPDLELQAVLRRGEGMDSSDDHLGHAPFDQVRAVSPPLLPLPSQSMGRARAGSIGRDRAAASSPATLAGLYAEKVEIGGSPGQVDMRTTPEEQHRVSPPLEAGLFSSGVGAPPAFSSPSSPPNTSAASSGFQSGIALGFAPLGHHGVTSSPLRSTPLPAFDHSPHHSPSSPSSFTHPASPPLPVVDSCFPDTSFPDLPPVSSTSPLASPTSLATSSPIPAPPIDLLPPPSPHRTPISLPPPLVAPAPLPPHLGGPPLHNAAPVRHKPSRSKLAAAAAAAAAAGGIGGSDHAPKKHSPLASPALNGDGEEDEDEKGLGADMEEESEEVQESAEKPEVQEETVEQALEAAEQTEMDLGVGSRETAPPASSVEDRTPSPMASEEHGDTLIEPLPATFSAPTPSSPPRSGWDMDDASEDEEEDATTPTGLTTDVDEGFASNSPPSSPTTTRLEAAQAEASGDLALARMSRDRPSSLSTSSTTSALQSISLSPNRSGPPPQLHFAAEPHQQGDTSPFGFGGMDLDQERMGSGAGMEGEGEETSALGLDTHGVVDRDEEGEVIAIDEDSLSALERIFICAKSESVEERARVAHNLADWLTAVDICEAAEYVLPLLGGLATDLEDIVKEVFAPQLDRIMWHFFSQCPLIELDSPSDTSSPEGSPVPSRYVPMPTDHGVVPSPSSAHFISDDSGSTSTPPPTSKTSPSNTEVSDVPRISVATFTSLLGALLTDQSSLVAKSTESALVRFLCRLKGKPLPAASLPPSPSPDALKSTAICDPADYLRPSADESTHHHHPYQLTPEACRVLEDEFVTGIVLGLARLDDDERDPEKSMEDVDLSSSSTTRRAPSAVPAEDTPPMTLVLSPEEEQIEDGWLAAGAATSGGPFDSQVGPTAEGWGEPMTSFFDDGLDRVNGDASGGAGVIASSSPMEPVYSSFSPDGHGDEESAIGKMVSMSLIGAIAAANCLEAEVLVQQILPEVDRMKTEPMFYVRKEATQALGSLARTLPVEVLETVVLPLHAAFARDTLWHVRRAACLTLPAVCKRLSPAALRTQAVALIKAFSSDSSRNVRSGALEVCGELTYLFHGDPLGVPDEILAIFLGQATPSTNGNTALPFASSQLSDNVFAPLQSALDSPPETFFDESTNWNSQSLFASSRDPDRPVMCAFNFPAIALTLGGDQWHLLKSYHLELCRDEAPKVRQSLASSLHEIAKIIGSDRSDECLLEPFSWYIRDQDHIQGAMLENISTLLRSFGMGAGRHALELLNEAWSDIKTWRRREALVEELGNLSAHFMSNGVAEELLGVLGRAFKDHVAAVREKAGGVIPHLFAATASDAETRSKVCAFLAVFSEDASYRNRMTFTSCSLASVREGVDRDIFETYFLPTLSRLSRDNVVNVQIGVARVIGEACQSGSLYADPAERLPLFDILSTLAHSGERDVISPVADYYHSDSPHPSPGLDAFDRAGAQSRTDNYSHPMELEGSSGLLPMAARRSHHHGFGDEDEEMTDASMAGEGEGNLSLDDLGDDVDFDLGDDCEPIFDRPSPSPMQQVWTRDVEGEDSFVEVSHR